MRLLRRAGWTALAAAASLVLVTHARNASARATGEDPPFQNFAEPGFPFIVSTVDARSLGSSFSPGNVATRGVVLMLGNETYAVFDPDLLRMAVGWRGGFINMVTMAQVSYQQSQNKNNGIPKVLGNPTFTNGMYEGWMGTSPSFTDPRPAGPNPVDPGRGPISVKDGRWNGIYVVGDHAVLSYTAHGTEIHEQPGSVAAGGEVGIVRAFETGAVAQPLTLVIADVPGAGAPQRSGNTVTIPQGSAGDTVTAVGVVGAGDAKLEVQNGRYVTLSIPAGAQARRFQVTVWRGPAARRAAFDQMLRTPATVARFAAGGPSHWQGSVTTKGVLSPDTSAYVVDRLTLPLPNPWRRNVRVAGLDFFPDGRAVVVTFDGDVWIVDGIDRGLQHLVWKRFASGMYEPLSVQVVDNQIYVFARGGIIRPKDLNGDGEADFYENFSNLIVQSIESREFPMDMQAKRGGGFYLAKGGALDNGPKTAPQTFPGFRAGSRFAGTVSEVSADGRSIQIVARGLREPFLGLHPTKGILTASDQQGNFVPSTPIYIIHPGGYYGVVPTAHGATVPTGDVDAMVWIPHEIDQSAAGQAWVTGNRMGFGGDALIHLSYGRPGVFRVYMDSTAKGVQGSLVSLTDGFTAPLLKAKMRPQDGQLYLTGFEIWGSNAKEVSTFARLRYTGQPSTIPLSAKAGQQGVLLRFATPLDRKMATDESRYDVQRWNYKRTENYGSGHFKVDGSAGQDRLQVASANLSADGKSLLLVLPDMRPVNQLQVAYQLKSAAGKTVADTLYMTVNSAPALNLASAGFAGLDWRKSLANAATTAAPVTEAPATAARGAQIFQRAACAACHSVDGSTAGKLGPSLRGVFGSRVTFTDGTSRVADEAYIRQSLLDPGSQIVKGYEEGMPSFRGVLSESEINSLILYIRSLGTASARPAGQ
jgi:cytochrome c2